MLYIFLEIKYAKERYNAALEMIANVFDRIHILVIYRLYTCLVHKLYLKYTETVLGVFFVFKCDTEVSTEKCIVQKQRNFQYKELIQEKLIYFSILYLFQDNTILDFMLKYYYDILSNY